MTHTITIDDLNAAPVGSKVADALSDMNGDIALWVKFPDQSWHLIEQGGAKIGAGTDWSGPHGDTAEAVAAQPPLEFIK